MSEVDRGVGYDAFISYSHVPDGALAAALQTGLERFAKPWYRSRALRVFRDTSSLPASPDLWDSIEEALASSTWLVLMASPRAAQSSWVNREVTRWLEKKSPQRLLIVLTSGDFACADDAAPGDKASAALPPALRGVFANSPHWVDLRKLPKLDPAGQSNLHLQDCVANVASAIRGIPKDMLVGEHLRQHRRTMRLARGGLTTLTVSLIAVGVVALVAWNQRNQAAAAQLTAIARGVVGEADRVRDHDPRRALQLGVAANQLDPSPLTQASLTQTLVSSLYFATLTGYNAPVYAVAFSPDGQTLATSSGDQTVALWDVSNPERPHQLGHPLTNSSLVAFSPDGRILATSSADKTTALWDLSNRNYPDQVGQLPTNSLVVFSPDGRTIATANADETIVLWDLSDHYLLRPLGQLPTSFSLVAFSPDGRTMVTGGADGETAIILWDITDRAQPHQLNLLHTGHTSVVDAIAFSPDGRTLATGSWDHTAILWDIENRNNPNQLSRPLTGHTDSVDTLAFSPDGNTLATGSVDNTVRLWDITDRYQPDPLGWPLTGHTNAVGAVAFSPNGHTLASASQDKTVILWDLTNHGRPHRLGRPLVTS